MKTETEKTKSKKWQGKAVLLVLKFRAILLNTRFQKGIEKGIKRNEIVL